MYKRILTIQDISCVGQCSLTVALPILSACGHETAILPSAVLSTHTAGFSGYTVRDLTDDIPAISQHWKKEDISFDSIYTGYLGSTKQIGYVKDIFALNAKPDCLKVVDPAMADNGKLYPAFDMQYVEQMKTLCAMSDIVIPNITEACFLTNTQYQETYDKNYIEILLQRLYDSTHATVVLTGVSYQEGKTGVVVYENGKYSYYEHRKIAKGCHGTGDVYASAFVGSLLKDKTIFESAVIAADYVVSCIELSQDDPKHFYGVKFELALSSLMEKLK